MTALPRSILLLGAGKMGGAMLKGWLDKGMAGSGISVLDPHPGSDLAALAGQHGFSLNPDQPVAPDVVVLAVKPQMFAEAAPRLAALDLGRSVAVSIMAGVTVATIGKALGSAAVVRAMPNTPAAIGRGITGAFASPAVSPAQREATHALLSAVGAVEWLPDESAIDMVTAVSGSGPAYVFYLTECLAAAGTGLGLEPALAGRLARATVQGAGALMASEAGTGPDQLRRNVTSPKGTTAEALAVLQGEDALMRLMRDAVAAAHRRATELGS